MKEQLLSIKTIKEASSRFVLLEKASWLDTIFKLFAELYLSKTTTQDENLAANRRDRLQRREEEHLSPSIRAARRALTTAEMSPEEDILSK